MMQSRDWGEEVLGVVRAPMYLYRDNMALPLFLQHRFAGSAREQFLDAIRTKQLVTAELMKQCMQAIGYTQEDGEKAEQKRANIVST